MTKARRRGFVLVSVLWLLVVVGAIAGSAALEGRVAIETSWVRLAADRARWTAIGCLAQVRASVDASLLAQVQGYRRDRVWRDLSTTLPDLADDGCQLELEVPGGRYNANSADSSALLRLFTTAGFVEEAPELLDALLDWRDADDDPRPLGAESAWYEVAGLPRPANVPLRSIRELQRVRGFAERPELVALLSTDEHPVALLHAPAPVIAALSVVDPVLLAHIVARRATDAPIGDLRDLLSGGDTVTQAAAMRAYVGLAGRVSIDPPAWRVRATVRDGDTRLQVTVEHLLRRSLHRVHVEEERVW